MDRKRRSRRSFGRAYRARGAVCGTGRGHRPGHQYTASAGETDSLDLWAEDRDHNEQQSAAAQYVSRDVVGYQDLDGYGQWVTEPSYGIVWVPVVAAGWAPYHYGYWNWIGPVGLDLDRPRILGLRTLPLRALDTREVRVGLGARTANRTAASLLAGAGGLARRTLSKNKSGRAAPPEGRLGTAGLQRSVRPAVPASPNYVRAANLSNTHLGKVDVERYVDARQHGGARGPERRYANESVTGAYAEAPREAFASTKATSAPRVLADPNDSLQAKFVRTRCCGPRPSTGRWRVRWVTRP